MTPKSFNSSYNISYNTKGWLEDLLGRLDRTEAEITFNPHLFDRMEYHNFNLDKVEETVRKGKVIDGKCEEPNKLCFARYFGKENITYTVITLFHDTFIEVKTVWPRKGR